MLERLSGLCRESDFVYTRIVTGAAGNLSSISRRWVDSTSIADASGPRGSVECRGQGRYPDVDSPVPTFVDTDGDGSVETGGSMSTQRRSRIIEER